MTVASDNEFPKVIFVEGSAPATPDSGEVKLYAKSDGLLYSKDDAGTETLVSGGSGSAPTFAGARVFNNANVALSTATETTITFNSERYDSDGYHSTVTNTGRLTIPSGKAGKYHIGANVRVTGSPGDPSYIRFLVNGTTVIAVNFIFNNSTIPMGLLACDYDLAVGDYIEVQVYVQSGSKNATANANYSPEFWLHLIGA